MLLPYPSCRHYLFIKIHLNSRPFSILGKILFADKQCNISKYLYGLQTNCLQAIKACFNEKKPKNGVFFYFSGKYAKNAFIGQDVTLFRYIPVQNRLLSFIQKHSSLYVIASEETS